MRHNLIQIDTLETRRCIFNASGPTSIKTWWNKDSNRLKQGFPAAFKTSESMDFMWFHLASLRWHKLKHSLREEARSTSFGKSETDSGCDDKGQLRLRIINEEYRIPELIRPMLMLAAQWGSRCRLIKCRTRHAVDLKRNQGSNWRRIWLAMNFKAVAKRCAQGRFKSNCY